MAMRGCIFGDPGTHRPPLLLVIFVLEFWFFFCLQFQGVFVCGCIYWWPWHSQTSTPLVFFGFWLCLCLQFKGLDVWLYLLVTLALADEDPSWPNLPSNTNKTACTIVQNVEHWLQNMEHWLLNIVHWLQNKQNINQSATELSLRMPEKPNY